MIVYVKILALVPAVERQHSQTCGADQEHRQHGEPVHHRGGGKGFMATATFPVTTNLRLSSAP